MTTNTVPLNADAIRSACAATVPVAFTNPLLPEVLSVAREALISRVVKANTADWSIVRKYRTETVKSITIAYMTPGAADSPRTLETLYNRTGLRIEQITQFGIEEMRALTGAISNWALSATKSDIKAAHRSGSEELDRVLSQLSALDVWQTLRANGAQEHDTVTLSIGQTNTLKITRAGKHSYAIQNGATGKLEAVTSRKHGEFYKGHMTEGRRQRIARELSAARGDRSKLSPSDRKWANGSATTGSHWASIEKLMGALPST